MGNRAKQNESRASARGSVWGHSMRVTERITHYAYGPQLLNWWHALTLFAVAIYLHFVSSPDLSWSDWYWRLAAVAAAQIVFTAGYFSAYKFINFLAPKRRGASAFFVSLPIIGALRGLALQLLLTWFGVEQSADSWFRMVASAIYLPALLVALGYLQGLIAEWLEEGAKLRQSRVDLDELLAYHAGLPESNQPLLLDSVKADISMEIELTPVDYGMDDYLRRIVHGVLRPQWNAMLSVTPLPDWRGMVALPQRTTAKLLLGFLTLRRSVHPLAITLVVLVGYLPVVVSRGGLLPALTFAGLTFGALLPGLLLIRSLLNRPIDRINDNKRLWAMAGALVAAQLPFLVLVLLLLGSTLPIAECTVVSVTSALATTLVLGLGGAISAENQQLEVQLEGIAENIERRAIQVNVRYWYDYRFLARRLQGPVFAEVLGKLRKYSRPQIGDSLSDLGTVLGRHRFVSRLMQVLALPRLPLEPKSAIDAFAEPWSDFFKLSPTRVEPDANRILIADQATCEAVVELVREAVALGVDKSRATMAAVEIETTSDDCILVRVTDNGIWSQEPKLLLDASRHFMECTLDYQATRKGTGAVIEFKVPLLV